MGIPGRLERQRGRSALVDGISFEMPVVCGNSPALMAAFTIDARKASALIAGAAKFSRCGSGTGAGCCSIVVINYLQTTIGRYVEFSIGIACTHGKRPAPPLLPAALMKTFGTGQYVIDLPVSSEISVKGGKGIWGMPKHQANLDFRTDAQTVSSLYALDGQEALMIEIDRPGTAWLPMRMAAANYCAFRGMLMKSYIHFRGKAARLPLQERVGTAAYRLSSTRAIPSQPRPRSRSADDRVHSRGARHAR